VRFNRTNLPNAYEVFDISEIISCCDGLCIWGVLLWFGFHPIAIRVQKAKSMMMSLHIFDTFARMITNLPVAAVVGAIDIECKMLEDDFEYQRLSLPGAVLSILCFGQFVRMVQFGEAMSYNKRLPPEHVEFYKDTIARLVQANELPPFSMEQFDNTFHSIL
jgi:hypothetical protein